MNRPLGAYLLTAVLLLSIAFVAVNLNPPALIKPANALLGESSWMFTGGPVTDTTMSFTVPNFYAPSQAGDLNANSFFWVGGQGTGTYSGGSAIFLVHAGVQLYYTRTGASVVTHIVPFAINYGPPAPSGYPPDCLQIGTYDVVAFGDSIQVHLSVSAGAWTMTVTDNSNLGASLTTTCSTYNVPYLGYVEFRVEYNGVGAQFTGFDRTLIKGTGTFGGTYYGSIYGMYASNLQHTSYPYSPAQPEIFMTTPDPDTTGFYFYNPSAPRLFNPVDGAQLTSMTPTFTWWNIPSAQYYMVAISDPSTATQIFASPHIYDSTPSVSHSLTYQLADSSVLVPGNEYRWSVLAYTSHGWTFGTDAARDFNTHAPVSTSNDYPPSFYRVYSGWAFDSKIGAVSDLTASFTLPTLYKWDASTSLHALSLGIRLSNIQTVYELQDNIDFWYSEPAQAADGFHSAIEFWSTTHDKPLLDYKEGFTSPVTTSLLTGSTVTLHIYTSSTNVWHATVTGTFIGGSPHNVDQVLSDYPLNPDRIQFVVELYYAMPYPAFDAVLVTATATISGHAYSPADMYYNSALFQVHDANEAAHNDPLVPKPAFTDSAGYWYVYHWAPTNPGGALYFAAPGVPKPVFPLNGWDEPAPASFGFINATEADSYSFNMYTGQTCSGSPIVTKSGILSTPGTGTIIFTLSSSDPPDGFNFAGHKGEYFSWTAMAFRHGVAGAPSSCNYFRDTKEAPTTGPNAPNLHYVPTNVFPPTFSWDASTSPNVDYYKLTVTKAGFTLQQDHITTTYWTPAYDSLTSGVQYTWCVYAHSSAGYGNPACGTFGTATSTPPQVTMIYPGDGTIGVLPDTIFTWSSTGYATIYVQIAIANGIYLNCQATATQCHLPFGTLDPNTTYHWHIVAIDSAGNKYDAAPWFTFTTGDYAGSVPTNLSPIDGASWIYTQDWATFNWNGVAGANGYQFAIIDNDAPTGSGWIENLEIINSQPNGFITTNQAIAHTGKYCPPNHHYSWYVWAHTVSGWSAPASAGFTLTGITTVASSVTTTTASTSTSLILTTSSYATTSSTTITSGTTTISSSVITSAPTTSTSSSTIISTTVLTTTTTSTSGYVADVAQITFLVSGSGSISPSGYQQYPAGTVVSVIATPASGWHLDHYESILSGVLGTVSPVSYAATSYAVDTVTAVFAQDLPPPQVTFSVSGSGSITPSGVHTYLPNQQVVIYASPSAGYMLDHWQTGSWGRIDPGANYLYLNWPAGTIDTVQAVFSAIPPSLPGQATVILNYNVPISSGVTSLIWHDIYGNPTTVSLGSLPVTEYYAIGILPDCPISYSPTPSPVEVCTVQATPMPGYAFSYWSTTGGVYMQSPTSAISRYAVTGDGTITAHYTYTGA